MKAALATLLAGQILNGLAAVALYPLALRLSHGNRWAAVGAVLVAGLLSHIPAIYTNWGRFAQLAGQVILPAALWLLWEALENPPPRPHMAGKRRVAWGVLALAGLVLAGMLLSYYRMAFYYAAFALALIIVWALPRYRFDRRQWLPRLAALALIALIGAGLFLPWAPRLFSGNLVGFVEAGVTGGSDAERVRADYAIWKDVLNYVWPWQLALALGGLALSLWRKNWALAGVVLWYALLAAIPAGALVRLPAANMMQSFAVLIALYIPVSLLAGFLLGEAAAWIIRHWRRLGPVLAFAAFAAAGVWGLRIQRTIPQPIGWALAARPDLRAMGWIRANTPEDARFLIESASKPGGWAAVGTDAGWWLPVLAGRENTLPPEYALLNEAPAEVGYTQRTLNLVLALEQSGVASPAGVRALCLDGVTHLYIGQRQGKIGLGVSPLFTAQELLSNPAFERIYHQDGVSVFRLDPQACEAAR